MWHCSQQSPVLGQPTWTELHLCCKSCVGEDSVNYNPFSQPPWYQFTFISSFDHLELSQFFWVKQHWMLGLLGKIFPARILNPGLSFLFNEGYSFLMYPQLRTLRWPSAASGWWRHQPYFNNEQACIAEVWPWCKKKLNIGTLQSMPLWYMKCKAAVLNRFDI